MTVQSEWKWVKLDEAVDILDNLRKPVNSDDRKKRIANKDSRFLFPYYGATGQVGWIDDYLTEGEYILVGEDGAPFLDFGRDKAYKIKGKTWVNNHAHILRAKVDVALNDFLLYYLNSINYSKHVNGTTRLKLTKGSLSEIPFPLPTIDVQKLIVSKIEELFSELDKGMEQLKTAQQQLKVYRQSVLKYAFESTAKLGGISALEDLTENLFDGPFGSSLKTQDYTQSGVRVIRLENIGALTFKDEYKTYVSETKYEKLKRHTVSAGDLIFSSFISEEIRVTILPPSIKKAVNKADCFCIRVDPKKTNPHFLLYYLSSRIVYHQLVTEVHGATRPRINTKQLRNLVVPTISIADQNDTVSIIQTRLSVADKLEETINNSFLQAESLRQSILKKAFEGKLLSQAEFESIQEQTKSIAPPELKIAAEPQLTYKTKKPDVPFPKTIEGIKDTDLHAGILAMVIDAHEKSPEHHLKLSHVKGEKIAHLVEAHIGIDLGRNPRKDAAGPDDFPHLKRVESRALKAGWFGVKKLRVGQTYVSKRGMTKIVLKVRETLPSNDLQQIEKLIQTFLPFELEHAEVIATLYAAWNNLLMEHKNPTDEEIVYEARENWSKRKLGIERKAFFKALKWMQEHALIPKGRGKVVFK